MAEELRKKFEAAGQGHVFHDFEHLSPSEKETLLKEAQVSAVRLSFEEQFVERKKKKKKKKKKNFFFFFFFLFRSFFVSH